MHKPIRGRFAPSPSGRMHLGNLAAALTAWLSVRSQNGVMLLRIEDLDPDRCRREYAGQLMEDLRWLGLDWDEGPVYQSERWDIYEEALRSLTASGRTYPCFCTRAELHAVDAPHAGGVFRYPGTCKTLSGAERTEKAKTRRPSLRFCAEPGSMTFDDLFCGPQSIDVENTFGDFLIRRTDGVHAYQLAVTVDDTQMGVTEVVRGRDLLTSTGCQIQLFSALGFTPPQYGHLPLLVNREGRRLSKRDGDLDMGALRARFTPEELCGKLAALLGLLEQPEPLPARELIPLFPNPSLSRETAAVSKDFGENRG